MKNETRKKTNNNTAFPESADVRLEIAKRAYKIWLHLGAGHVCHLDHWLRAERELAGSSLGGPVNASA